jgi:hypothetical protein
MFHPVIPSLALAYQESLAKEAERERIGKVLVSAKPTFQKRALLRMGNLLILWGLKLRERYEPAICCCPEPYSSLTGKASV